MTSWFGRLLCALGLHRIGNEWVNCCISDGVCTRCRKRILSHWRGWHTAYSEDPDNCSYWKDYVKKERNP